MEDNSIFMSEINKWIILDRLVDVIVGNCGGCIVEIGMGYSTLLLVKHACQTSTTLYSCDIDPKKVRIKGETNHVVFHGTSVDFMNQFKDKPSVVFIDGSHHYEVAKEEADFFLEVLVPGGVMFFHDTFPPTSEYLQFTHCGDVYKLRHELENNPKLSCFTWPYTANSCGLTMVMKKPVCCVD